MFEDKFDDLPFKAAKSIKLPSELWVPPPDPRFPNQNQTRNCWQNFVDYHRCFRKFGEGYADCEYFKRAYSSLCPNEWVERWEGQLEKGAFPARLDPPKAKHH